MGNFCFVCFFQYGRAQLITGDAGPGNWSMVYKKAGWTSRAKQASEQPLHGSYFIPALTFSGQEVWLKSYKLILTLSFPNSFWLWRCTTAIETLTMLSPKTLTSESWNQMGGGGSLSPLRAQVAVQGQPLFHSLAHSLVRLSSHAELSAGVKADQCNSKAMCSHDIKWDSGAMNTWEDPPCWVTIKPHI